jgi:hypothetical protein
MVDRAGLSTHKVFAADGPAITTHDTVFTFLLRRPAS